MNLSSSLVLSVEVLEEIGDSGSDSPAAGRKESATAAAS